jgi:hypothetical protein
LWIYLEGKRSFYHLLFVAILRQLTTEPRGEGEGTTPSSARKEKGHQLEDKTH